MTSDILPSQIRIASNGDQIIVGVVFPRPGVIISILIALLAWTTAAILITGLGSLVSLFFISVSLGINLLALFDQLREQEVYNDYSY